MKPIFAQFRDGFLVPLEATELRIDELALFSLLEQATGSGHRLFAYPAQSNFTGVQHPLAWIKEAQDRGWDVLLDAASLLSAFPSLRLLQLLLDAIQIEEQIAPDNAAIGDPEHIHRLICDPASCGGNAQECP